MYEVYSRGASLDEVARWWDVDPSAVRSLFASGGLRLRDADLWQHSRRDAQPMDIGADKTFKGPDGPAHGPDVLRPDGAGHGTNPDVSESADVAAERCPLPLTEAGLLPRTVNAVLGAGFRSVDELAALDVDEIARIPGLGGRSIEDVVVTLTAMGLPLGPPSGADHVRPPHRDTRLEDVGFSVRVANALRRAGFSTLGQVADVDPGRLAAIPNMGRRSLVEIEEIVRAACPEAGGAPRAAGTGWSGRDDGPAAEISSVVGTGEEIGRPGITDTGTSGAAGPGYAGPAATPPTGTGTSARDTDLVAAFPLQGARHRDAARRDQMVALRLEGRSVSEIATRFGVSRQRVSQILRAEGATAGAARIAAAKRRDEAEAALLPQTSELFREGWDLDEIASRVGLSPGRLAALMRDAATPGDRAARRAARSTSRRSAALTFSDADLLAGIRRIAERDRRVPSSNRYQAVAPELGLASLPTVANRFGGWAAAVRLAGLVPQESPRREYTRTWTADRCWRALRHLTDELGAPPTAAQYDLLASNNDDLPSQATVRNRLGRWSEIVARLHDRDEHPILSRIGVTGGAESHERTEAIWLAHLADEIDDDELRRLAREGLFEWDPSFGEAPTWVACPGEAGPDDCPDGQGPLADR